MVLVKPVPDPAHAAYLLLDDIGERLCATWAVIPKPVRQHDSLVELASACARAAVCSFDEAMDRLPMLLELGILRRNGTVDKKVKAELDRRGAQCMNVDKDEGAGAGGEDGEDEGEEL